MEELSVCGDAADDAFALGEAVGGFRSRIERVAGLLSPQARFLGEERSDVRTCVRRERGEARGSKLMNGLLALKRVGQLALARSKPGLLLNLRARAPPP